MKPLFTIHGGEYLFANQVESRFPDVKIWVPGKDIGLDFLLTDAKCTKPLRLQIKYSRDFNWTIGSVSVKPEIRTTTWYSISKSKLQTSEADYWVLVNYDGFRKTTDFLFATPAELLKKFEGMESKKGKIECYITVTNSNKAYETRNLKKADQVSIINNSLDGSLRDFTPFLNRWDLMQNHFMN